MMLQSHGRFVTMTATNANIAGVCWALRDEDAREAFATLEDGDPQTLIATLIAQRDSALCFWSLGDEWQDGTRTPFALIGIWPTYHGVGAGVMLTTPAFAEIAGEAARWVRHALRPFLIERGLRRVEVRALKEAVTNRRWIELLGGRFECELPGLGKNGETFVQYAWLKETPNVHHA